MSHRRRSSQSSTIARLHQTLVANIARASALSSFAQLALLEPAIRAFASPAALVAHLTDRTVPIDARNAVLGRLLAAARTRGEIETLATSLLWLAFWPGICALSVQQRAFLPDEDERTSRIVAHFAEHLARVEPARTTNLAATLLLDTRCSVIEERRREGRDAIAQIDPECEAADAAADADLATLDAMLCAAAGADAGLVLAHAVVGTPIAELARDAALSEHATRKRIQRALGRMRSDLEA